jgi:hypothetical protein
MKLFCKALLVLSIIGGSFNGVCNAGQGPQALSLNWESWAYSLVDPFNPLRLPIKCSATATLIAMRLAKAAKDAYIKKEFTPQLSSSIFSSLGFAALTMSPWIIYRIWFKNFYNAQMQIYATIRDIVKKHYESHVLNMIACSSCFNQSQIMYATEKAWVLGHAESLRRVSRLYMAKDAHLIKLLKSYYANLEAGKPCYNQYIAIQSHCMGILP